MTQMTELVENAIKSYFSCIPHVPETRVKNEYVNQKQYGRYF